MCSSRYIHSLQRVAVALLFFFSLSLSVVAQGSYPKERYFGVSAGTTLSRVSFNPSVSQNYLTGGFAGGVTYRYVEEKYFGFQIELNYVQQGWNEDFSNEENPIYSYSRRINYLELPFLTHVFFDVGSTSRIIFNVGPKIGLYLSDKATTNFDVYNLPDFSIVGRTTAQQTLEIENTLDYAICAGLGYEFRTGSSTYYLEGRYSFGLGDIFNNSPSDDFSASSNQVIYITLGYLFNVYR